MTHGHLLSPDTYAPLLLDPVWNEAFDWLRNMPAEPAKGIHPLRGDEMFVNVMKYDTLPREQCNFESHRKYVDLQYTIRGGETIEWRRSSELTAAGPYDDPKDLQFYQLGDAPTRLHMPPGYFAVFYPSDAHLPKVLDGVHASVYKAVIKVGIHLLGRR
jgi:biofilm protein TabA